MASEFALTRERREKLLGRRLLCGWMSCEGHPWAESVTSCSDEPLVMMEHGK